MPGEAGGLPQFGQRRPAHHLGHLTKILTGATRAVIVEHLYGHPADMTALNEITNPRCIAVIEYAAHALGARWHGRPAGSLSLAGIHSFAGKGIDTRLPGGAVITDDHALADQVELMRRHGRTRANGRRNYTPQRVGFSLLMSEVGCAVGMVQLRHFAARQARRARIFEIYQRAFHGLTLVRLLPIQAGAEPSFLHIGVHSARRDDLHDFLTGHGVGTNVYYADLVHQQPCFIKAMGYHPGSFPGAEAFHQTVLVLPCHVDMEEAEQRRIIQLIHTYETRHGGDRCE